MKTPTPPTHLCGLPNEVAYAVHGFTRNATNTSRPLAFWLYFGGQRIAHLLLFLLGGVFLALCIGLHMGGDTYQRTGFFQPSRILEFSLYLCFTIALFALARIGLWYVARPKIFKHLDPHCAHLVSAALHNIHWSPNQPVDLVWHPSHTSTRAHETFTLDGTLTSGHTLSIRCSSTTAHKRLAISHVGFRLQIDLTPPDNHPHTEPLSVATVQRRLQTLLGTRFFTFENLVSPNLPKGSVNPHAWSLYASIHYPSSEPPFTFSRICPALDGSLEYPSPILSALPTAAPNLDPSLLPLLDPIRIIQPTLFLRLAPFSVFTSLVCLLYAMFIYMAPTYYKASLGPYLNLPWSTAAALFAALALAVLFVSTALVFLDERFQPRPLQLHSPPPPRASDLSFSLLGPATIPIPTKIPHAQRIQLLPLILTSSALVAISIAIFIIPQVLPYGTISHTLRRFTKNVGPIFLPAILLHVAASARIPRLMRKRLPQRTVPLLQPTISQRGSILFQPTTSPPSIAWSIHNITGDLVSHAATVPFTPTDLSIQLSQPPLEPSNPTATLTFQPLALGSEPLHVELPASLWPNNTIPADLPRLTCTRYPIPNNQHTDFLQTLRDLAQTQAIPLPHHLPTPKTSP